MTRRTRWILALAAIAVLGLTMTVFADRNPWHNGRMGMGGWGWSSGGYNHGNGHGFNYMGDITPEQIVQVEKERNEFFKQTEDLRRILYAKEMELRNELGKERPDPAVASELQSELSKLRSEFDQKSLEFKLQMRDVAPGYNRDYHGYSRMNGYGTGGSCCL
jgi:Spy/CpxP family protein refolding chaperone